MAIISCSLFELITARMEGYLSTLRHQLGVFSIEWLWKVFRVVGNSRTQAGILLEKKKGSAFAKTAHGGVRNKSIEGKEGRV